MLSQPHCTARAHTGRGHLGGIGLACLMSLNCLAISSVALAQLPEPKPTCAEEIQGNCTRSDSGTTGSNNRAANAQAWADYRFEMAQQAQQTSNRLNAEGTTLFNNGDISGAIRKYKAALSIYSKNSYAGGSLALSEGILLYRNKDFSGSLQKFMVELQKYPANREIIRTWMNAAAEMANSDGHSRFGVNDFVSALRLYRQALALSPDSTVFQSNIAVTEGFLLAKKGDYAGGARKLELAQRIHPPFLVNVARLRYQMAGMANADGDRLSAAGDEKGALRRYREAAVLAPNDILIRVQVNQHEGRVLFARKDFDGAIAKYRQALTAYGSNQSVQADLAAAEGMKAVQDGDFDTAKQRLCSISHDGQTSSDGTSLSRWARETYVKYERELDAWLRRAQKKAQRKFEVRRSGSCGGVRG